MAFRVKQYINRKTILTKLFQILFIFLLLELLLRIAYYQQNGFDSLAFIEYTKKVKNNFFPHKQHVYYKNHYLVRPDSTDEVNEQIADECMAANLFQYSPATDYKNMDHSGRYVNVVGFERKTVPSEFLNSSSSLPPLIIRFMGGSTMFGLNNTDAETIPSCFTRLYKERFPNGRSIKVVNNAICGYHSYNELELFSRLCFTGEKCDIVIFLDGLNDMVMTRSVQERLSYSYYRLLLSNRITAVSAKEIARVTDSTFHLYETPEVLQGKSVSDTLLKRYSENLNNIRDIALINKCLPYFFIQPNPFFNYTNRKNDPICMQDEKPILSEAYQKLEKQADSSKNLYFLGNMLQYEKGYPFVDLVHYSPMMSGKIALEILDHIGATINNYKSVGRY